MLTDDPGTPGDGKWEINVAAMLEHAGDTTTWALPLIDANYGVGDRIQLNFQLPYLIEHRRGEDGEAGLGNGQVALKWRFFDAGEDGWQISMYPRVDAPMPANHSALATPGVSYLLPFEFEHKIGGFGVNFEVGRWLHPSPDEDTWIGGLAIGREVSKELELIAELHDEAAVHGDGDELALNFGARWTLSERCTILASAGTDLHNGLGDRVSALAYLGLQLNF